MKTPMKNDLTLSEAMHLQAIEGNPLDATDIAMFEMFERKGWSKEKRIAYIKEQATATVFEPAE